MMYRVLARKYRPISLDDMVGQSILVETLKQAILNNRVPHAILLHGIRGTGKTTTARIIARYLNCTNTIKSETNILPCNECSSCLSLNEDRHLDVVEIDAASRTGVDDIREIIESSKYRAVAGKFKIFIIDEVHMLSKSAFNALLKTLEEPPSHVKFIFATTELRKIPDTILSRCMRFDLKRIENTDIISHLKNIGIQEKLDVDFNALATIARVADGSMRDALSLLDQSVALSFGNDDKKITSKLVQEMLGLSDVKKIFDIISCIFQGQSEGALQSLQEILKSGGDPILVIQDLLDTLYWIICIKTAPNLANNVSWPEDMRNYGKTIALELKVSSLMRTWQALMHGYQEIQTSPCPHQSLEVLVIKLCYLSHLPSLSSLLEGENKSSSRNISFAPTSLLPDKNSLSHYKNEKDFGRNNQKLSEVSSQQSNHLDVPKNFEELIELLDIKKEILLSSQIIQDVRPVSFEEGKICVQLKNKSNASLLSELRSKLKLFTNMNWDISESSCEMALPTIAEQKEEAKKKLYKEILNHPDMQTLVNHFPEASLDIK